MWAAGRLLSTLLHGLSPFNAVAIGFSVGIVALVALVAAWLPANRAAKIDPLAALRAE